MKKITYDSTIDAAYIYFQNESSELGIVKNTYCCDPREVGWMINIDFDRDGKIYWIELISASHYLSNEVLKNAYWYDSED